MTHTCPTLLPPSNFIWLELGELRFGFPALVCSHLLAPNPTQPNTGAVRLYAEKENSNTTSKPTGHQVTPTSHCSSAWPLLLSLQGRKILPAGGGFRKNEAEACPAMELEFPFPTHPHCCQQPTFPWRTTHPKSCRASRVSYLADFTIWRQKTGSSITHLHRSIKNPWFMCKDPQVIPSRVAALTWSCRIQNTFQCKYQLR